jgi:iron complex transport system substrate-binding protein
MNNRLPSRIVSLQPSITVTLAHLGALDRLVACTKYCADVVPEVTRSRAIVADSWQASSQQILAAKPDLVLAAVPYQVESIVEILKTGIPFVALAPKSLHDVYADTAMIARLVGKEAEGSKMIAAMEAEIAAVRQKRTPLPRKRVYCEEWGKPLIHSQGWVAELIDAAGGAFIGAPGTHTTAETIAAADPDVICMAWCGAGDRVPLERVVEQRNWQSLRAVREGRVYCIPDEYLNTPAITLLAGLRVLAAAIHPDAFPFHPRLRAIRGIG